HGVRAREVREDEARARLGDRLKVWRVVRGACGEELLPDHRAARRLERLPEGRRPRRTVGGVEGAEVDAVAEPRPRPSPPGRRALPRARRETKVVATARVLREEVVGGDRVEPEAPGLDDRIPNRDGYAAADRADDHVDVVLGDQLVDLPHRDHPTGPV